LQIEHLSNPTPFSAQWAHVSRRGAISENSCVPLIGSQSPVPLIGSHSPVPLIGSHSPVPLIGSPSPGLDVRCWSRLIVLGAISCTSIAKY
jgi:hypothetical protein